MTGHGGGDTLIGGAGHDTLTGGSGGDRFVFRPGDGADVLTDFTNGSDVIDLGRFNFTDFAEAAGHFTAVATGVEFAFAADTILIVGMTLADLTGSDLLL